MSLINQVLQDLEKRNAENAPEQHHLNNVKAVPTARKTLYVLLLAILFIAGIIAFFAYNYDTTESKEVIVIPQKKPVIPGSIRISPLNNVAVNNVKAEQQPRVEIKPKETTVIEAITIDEEISTPTQIFQEPTIDPVLYPRTKKAARKKAKVLNYYQKAQQLFEQAKKQQNLIVKQRKLTRAVKLNPRHIKAWMLLVNTLLQQGLTEQAAITLDHSLSLFPQNLQFINLRSQLFLQQKQPQAALNTLNAIDIRYAQDETFLSLLAAAYQQNNEHLKSLQFYQKLLRINPDKAEYWLGLAIAQEKQGKAEQAVTAYQQALSKNTLKPVIVSYIKQRLSILK